MKPSLLLLCGLAIIGCGGDKSTPDDTGSTTSTTTASATTTTSTSTTTTATTTTTTTLPTEATDEFLQSPPSDVDVLFVVDNSCSMAEEQSALAQSFPVFMNYFLGSGLDYHIGVVSTYLNNPDQSGKLQGPAGTLWVDTNTPNPTAVFGSMAQLGTSGNAMERGRDAAYGALVVHATGFNAGFLRANSALHVIVLSDEDDHSSGLTNVEWITWLQGQQATRPAVSLSSIVGTSVGGATVEVGVDYIDATAQVGGVLWDINNPDYGQALSMIGITGSGLVSEFVLSQTPVLGTIEVAVQEGSVTYAFDEGIDWVYDATANSVLFTEFIPSPGATTRISYTIDYST